jgi:Domain of unknown function (DUF4440)
MFADMRTSVKEGRAADVSTLMSRVTYDRMRADMKTAVLLAFFACRLWCRAIHQPSSPEIDAKSQILDADAQYRNAVVRGDAAKLAIIFADDILIVHSDGGTDSKANFLDAISSGRLKLTCPRHFDHDFSKVGTQWKIVAMQNTPLSQ